MGIRITKRTAVLFAFDIVATFAAYYFASLLTDLVADVFATSEIAFVLGALSLVNICVLALFHLYNNLWEYASIDEAIKIFIAVGLSTLTGAVLVWAIGIRLPIRVYVVAWFLLIFFCGGMRGLYRVMRSHGRALAEETPACDRPRTLVVGAGETGSLVIDRMATKDPLMPGIPIVATDDNPSKQGLRMHGVRVAGGSDDILSLVERFDIEQIVVAIPSASLEERKRIYSICTQTDCKLRTLPNVRELRTDELDDIALRDVDVADLLGREEVILNTHSVAGYISGACILVTGGGGSIGSELARQVCTVNPRQVVIFDMYENDAYLLCGELSKKYPEIDFVVEIGSVCDKARLDDVFAQYHPDVVFHAAAHKHVPLMERCPREALTNNVFGTLNAVKAADEHGVSRFIFISTDKAVNPTSVMGATKRMGEMVMQYFAHTSETVFAAVRFGNVLGSNGSVIPLFKKQIASGGPITVTHPDIERYFMTIPEAARLVVQAGGIAEGGEIFILDMGEPVKIIDLAKSLIQLSGLTLGKDINITFTGLRPGEKMYEELLMDTENTLPTKQAGIMVSRGEEISHDVVAAKIDDLHRVISSTDEEALKVLAEAVPTYTYTPNTPATGEGDSETGVCSPA